MVLDSLRLTWISAEKGYGLFASEIIPKGTITFVQDDLDIVLSSASFKSLKTSESKYISLIEKYSYEDSVGSRIISWDLGKYMNHCCHANTLSTGYGFEVAIRDIAVGEEVTDDYRIFTSMHEMAELSCDKKECTAQINFERSPEQINIWDNKIREALLNFYKVEQALYKYLADDVIENLNSFKLDNLKYRSVSGQLPPPHGQRRNNSQRLI